MLQCVETLQLGIQSGHEIGLDLPAPPSMVGTNIHARLTNKNEAEQGIAATYRISLSTYSADSASFMFHHLGTAREETGSRIVFNKKRMSPWRWMILLNLMGASARLSWRW